MRLAYRARNDCLAIPVLYSPGLWPWSESPCSPGLCPGVISPRRKAFAYATRPPARGRGCNCGSTRRIIYNPAHSRRVAAMTQDEPGSQRSLHAPFPAIFQPLARRYAERLRRWRQSRRLKATLTTAWISTYSPANRAGFTSVGDRLQDCRDFFSDGESSDGSSQERRQAGRQEHQAATRQGQARGEEGQVSMPRLRGRSRLCELNETRRRGTSAAPCFFLRDACGVPVPNSLGGRNGGIRRVPLHRLDVAMRHGAGQLVDRRQQGLRVFLK